MGRHTPRGERDLGIPGIGRATPVAAGGSATVYRARQEAFERDVAIKVFRDLTEKSPRFRTERHCLGIATANAGAVTVLDAGTTVDDEPYLLFPWFDRGSLHGLVRRQGALPWEEAVFLLQPVAETLADLHASGVVHRDVKPGNVLLTDRFRPRITDFGAAATVGSAAPLSFTPGFAAPEAAFVGGAAASGAAPSLDVYGFGATLRFVLTGDQPEESATSGPDDAGPAAIPAPLAELLERCLADEPTDRPADGSVLAAELRRASRLTQEATEADASADDPARRARPDAVPAFASRWGWAVLSGAGLALLAIGRLLG